MVDNWRMVHFLSFWGVRLRRTTKNLKESWSVQRTACTGDNKIPSVCGKSGAFCDRFFLFPLQWGSGLREGGINKALNSHRTYKCFPLTLTLSPHFIRRPYGSLKGEGTILYILVYRLPNIPLSASRCPLHAFRSTLHGSGCPFSSCCMSVFSNIVPGR